MASSLCNDAVPNGVERPPVGSSQMSGSSSRNRTHLSAQLLYTRIYSPLGYTSAIKEQLDQIRLQCYQDYCQITSARVDREGDSIRWLQVNVLDVRMSLSYDSLVRYPQLLSIHYFQLVSMTLNFYFHSNSAFRFNFNSVAVLRNQSDTFKLLHLVYKQSVTENFYDSGYSFYVAYWQYCH